MSLVTQSRCLINVGRANLRGLEAVKGEPLGEKRENKGPGKSTGSATSFALVEPWRQLWLGKHYILLGGSLVSWLGGKTLAPD